MEFEGAARLSLETSSPTPEIALLDNAENKEEPKPKKYGKKVKKLADFLGSLADNSDSDTESSSTETTPFKAWLDDLFYRPRDAEGGQPDFEPQTLWERLQDTFSGWRASIDTEAGTEAERGSVYGHGYAELFIPNQINFFKPESAAEGETTTGEVPLVDVAAETRTPAIEPIVNGMLSKVKEFFQPHIEREKAFHGDSAISEATQGSESAKTSKPKENATAVTSEMAAESAAPRQTVKQLAKSVHALGVVGYGLHQMSEKFKKEEASQPRLDLGRASRERVQSEPLVGTEVFQEGPMVTGGLKTAPAVDQVALRLETIAPTLERTMPGGSHEQVRTSRSQTDTFVQMEVLSNHDERPIVADYLESKLEEKKLPGSSQPHLEAASTASHKTLNSTQVKAAATHLLQPNTANGQPERTVNTLQNKERTFVNKKAVDHESKPQFTDVDRAPADHTQDTYELNTTRPRAPERNKSAHAEHHAAPRQEAVKGRPKAEYKMSTPEHRIPAQDTARTAITLTKGAPEMAAEELRDDYLARRSEELAESLIHRPLRSQRRASRARKYAKSRLYMKRAMQAASGSGVAYLAVRLVF